MDSSNVDSEHNDNDSELNNSTNTEDFMQAIDQFQNQDFSKETSLPTEESGSWESMTPTAEGSLYLEPSGDASSGADSGLQAEDQQQQQEEQEEGGKEEESRSLLS